MEEKNFYNLKFLKRTAVGALLALVVLFVFLPWWAMAQQLDTGIEFGAYTGLVDTDIRIIIAKIIRVFFGVLGIVALGFTLYGGYLYMTAAGDENKVKSAKAILKNMVIGLAIILSALAITQFVINMLMGQYSDGDGTPTPPFQDTFCPDCGFLGSVVESHYPGRGAVDIPRNTKIVVTFKYEMLASSLITDSNASGSFGDTTGAVSNNNDSATTAFKVYPTELGESAALSPEAFDVFLASDNRTYVFKPKELLGSPLRDYNYTVKLNNDVKRADGSSAFGALGSYSWNFTVSTIVDLTPPQVVSIFPVPQENRYPRNVVIQINFDEPVDPISASGIFRLGQGSPNNFQNITAATEEGSNPLISGTYQITNQYHTVEFKTFDQCGVNPCGQPIFCLPGNKTILNTIKSATVDLSNKPQAQITANLYDGVVDMAGNSLNGAGELKRDAQKKLILDPGVKSREEWEATPLGQRVLRDFYWRFSTSNILDTTAPVVISFTPDPLSEGVIATAPLTLSFNKPMSIYTFREIVLRTNKTINVGYSSRGINFDSTGNVVTTPDQEISRTTAEILHTDFWQKPINAPAGTTDAIYYPFTPSLLNDAYQNCFYPAVLRNHGDCETENNGGELNHQTPSCFNLQETSYRNMCTSTTDGCPFNPPPYNSLNP